MFRKHIIRVLALLVFFAFATETTYAQSHKKSSSSHSKKKKKKKKSTTKSKKEVSEEDAKPETTFTDHLWYGGSVGLAFNAFENVSTFGIGVSPMVGYKFNEFLSAGPRVSLAFTSLKSPGYQSLGLFNMEAGVFLRGHIYEGFFIQGELSNEWIQGVDGAIGNKYTKSTYTRINQYVGAGYNLGRGQGGFGTEISLLYNIPVGRDINTGEQPISYRFGLTWRF